MIVALVVCALIVLLATWGVQAWWALRLACHYPPRALPEDAPDRVWPPVTILVPLRGSDPVLRHCLRGLCQQDYPSFQIHIVVDSPEDPAWDTIREVMAEFPAVALQAEVLAEPLPSCSLKVSALLQGIDSLDPDCQIVAQVDADVVPPADWLRLLVRPFDDPGVGAASGLRWFHTHSTAWGSLVRGLWGAGAAAQMYGLSILWGGSLAFRASILRDPVLRERWANSFVEDTSVVGHLQERGWKMHMEPRLTIINPESISLPGCYRFLRRQSLCVRLHHPAWFAVLLLTVGMTASVPIALGVAAVCWAQGAEALAWTVLGSLVGIILAAGLPLVWIDGYFYYTSPEDDRLAKLRLKHIPVIPLTLVVQLMALLAACRAREIDWRGIRYEIDQGSVRRLDYAPYTEAPHAPEQAQSIV